MSLLNGRLVLHGVDIEKLVARVLDDQLRATGARLGHHDREDALTHLVGLAWECSVEYDPERGLSFSTFAYRRCRLRLADWHRQRLNRTYYRRWDGSYQRLPERVALDDDDVGGPLAGGGLDPLADRMADLDLRALAARARRPEWLDDPRDQAGEGRAA